MATTSRLTAPAHDAVERVAAAGELLDGLSSELASLSDADVLSFTQRLASFGRLVDSLQIRAAGEVAVRSDAETSGRTSEGLLDTIFDCRNATELLENATGVPARVAQARMRLDRRTRASTGLSGQDIPARFPHVADALHRGALAEETAQYVTDRLARVDERGLASPAEITAAEEELVPAAVRGTIHDRLPLEPTTEAESAGGAPPATFHEVKIMVDTWVAFLGRDGVEADAECAERLRGVNLGRERDGLVHIWGDLVPETAAALSRLFDAHNGSPVRFAPTPSDDDADAPTDPRTAQQKRHDAFTSIVHTAAAAAESPTLGGAAPTLLVTVDARDLDGGIARIDGIDIPVPASIAHRIACTGAVQKMVFDDRGRLIRLGTKERLFNAHQRRAITARDGGCIIPGCAVPAAWCEIHHVEEHSHGGATHTDNGVLLCWWHHHNLDRSGWRIEMRRGVPHVAAPRWVDRHRRYRPTRNLSRYRPHLERSASQLNRAAVRV
ncbi:HNH endonuclease signature motif containing protein [Microbacterium halotolerans]|uniref:HNH endonuclease signature motif containing protein n=1 Tax=Microbacterium halotolerans TaxID=246613 RepID=UPI0013C304E7|nr:HNH endonuclease signature motif containing protein [Microbacterium halotolerans]